MKETPSRRITVTSSFDKISKDALRKQGAVGGTLISPTFKNVLLDRYKDDEDKRGQNM
jgi:hypothetical protein